MVPGDIFEAFAYVRYSEMEGGPTDMGNIALALKGAFQLTPTIKQANVITIHSASPLTPIVERTVFHRIINTTVKRNKMNLA